jgi:hypothetical protein
MDCTLGQTVDFFILGYMHEYGNLIVWGKLLDFCSYGPGSLHYADFLPLLRFYLKAGKHLLRKHMVALKWWMLKM